MSPLSDASSYSYDSLLAFWAYFVYEVYSNSCPQFWIAFATFKTFWDKVLKIARLYFYAQCVVLNAN